jgi:hypothetical protein
VVKQARKKARVGATPPHLATIAMIPDMRAAPRGTGFTSGAGVYKKADAGFGLGLLWDTRSVVPSRSGSLTEGARHLEFHDPTHQDANHKCPMPAALTGEGQCLTGGGAWWAQRGGRGRRRERASGGRSSIWPECSASGSRIRGPAGHCSGRRGP